MHPLTVLMCVFNGEKYLNEAVNSVLQQTFPNFDFLIINDNSTDNSRTILNEFSDSRMIIIDNEQNIGLTKSLNKGLRLAKGEFIARMDADDVCYPDRFEKQIDFLQANKDIAICGSAISYIGETKMESQQFPLHHDDIKVALLSYNPFAHPSVMWNRKCFEENNLYYNENYTTAQDYELWSRAVYKLSSANLPQTLLQYRKHANQIGEAKRKHQDKGAQQIKLNQLANLNLVPDDEEKIAHLCLFDGMFQQYKDAVHLKAADDWMNKIYEANKKLKIYNETSLLNNWKSVFFGESLYKYDLQIWKVLKNSHCRTKCNIPVKQMVKQFVKCLINWETKVSDK